MEQSLHFCDFTDAEFAGLSQELSAAFEFSPESLLVQYARWRSNFLAGGAVEDIPLTYKSSQPQFQEFVEGSQVVGVDLPIILSSEKHSDSRPVVMFVAQDPRRDPQTARSERITLGTPFALHVPWGRQDGVNTRLVYQAVQLWLERGWRAYLTDVIKLYAFDEAKGKARNLPQSDRSRFSTLLAAEIALFQPEVIVTIGAPAYHAIQQIQHSAKTIAIPHFSGANQGKWKKLLESGQRITNEAKLAWYRQTVENTGAIC